MSRPTRAAVRELAETFVESASIVGKLAETSVKRIKLTCISAQTFAESAFSLKHVCNIRITTPETSWQRGSASLTGVGEVVGAGVVGVVGVVGVGMGGLGWLGVANILHCLLQPSVSTLRRTTLATLSLARDRPNASTYIHTCIHTCMHAYVHSYTQTYMHAYIHTYIK